MSRFPIPAADAAAPFQTEIIIRRSRFLTHCAHTPGMEAARAFVEQIRTKHADATHNCWAFVAGAPGHSGQVGFSDDGEPHGTAGRPMLQVLLHCGVGEITMVVTRWFGGVKLGTGGLVRAYTESASAALAAAKVVTVRACVRLTVEVDYALYERAAQLLQAAGAKLDDPVFTDRVALSALLPAGAELPLLPAFAELSRGAAQPQVSAPFYAPL